jgi:hypothetical protein
VELRSRDSGIDECTQPSPKDFEDTEYKSRYSVQGSSVQKDLTLQCGRSEKDKPRVEALVPSSDAARPPRVSRDHPVLCDKQNSREETVDVNTPRKAGCPWSNRSSVTACSNFESSWEGSADGGGRWEGVLEMRNWVVGEGCQVGLLFGLP